MKEMQLALKHDVIKDIDKSSFNFGFEDEYYCFIYNDNLKKYNLSEIQISIDSAINFVNFKKIFKLKNVEDIKKFLLSKNSLVNLFITILNLNGFEITTNDYCLNKIYAYDIKSKKNKEKVNISSYNSIDYVNAYKLLNDIFSKVCEYMDHFCIMFQDIIYYTTNKNIKFIVSLDSKLNYNIDFLENLNDINIASINDNEILDRIPKTQIEYIDENEFRNVLDQLYKSCYSSKDNNLPIYYSYNVGNHRFQLNKRNLQVYNNNKLNYYKSKSGYKNYFNNKFKKNKVKFVEVEYDKNGEIINNLNNNDVKNQSANNDKNKNDEIKNSKNIKDNDSNDNNNNDNFGDSFSEVLNENEL